MQAAVTDFTQQLLAHMGMDDVAVAVAQDDDQYLHVQIDTDEQQSGMLIGYHGETVASLQKVIALAHRESLGDTKVIINVNDYKQKRTAVLEQMAQRYADRAREMNEPQVLPFLPANERLVIHMYLKGNEEVESYSQGDGAQRRLVIAPKQS